MHEVLVNRLGGLSLPTKSVVRLTDRPDMTLVVYRGHKTTTQQYITDRAMWPINTVSYTPTQMQTPFFIVKKHEISISQ